MNIPDDPSTTSINQGGGSDYDIISIGIDRSTITGRDLNNLHTIKKKKKRKKVTFIFEPTTLSDVW